MPSQILADATAPHTLHQSVDAAASPPLQARPHLDVSDELGMLEALHLALSEVGDGSAYVWHLRNGRLSGVVQPTLSFKDVTGKICRHLVLTLTSGSYSKHTEGISSRLHTGVWQLEG